MDIYHRIMATNNQSEISLLREIANEKNYRDRLRAQLDEQNATLMAYQIALHEVWNTNEEFQEEILDLSDELDEIEAQHDGWRFLAKLFLVSNAVFLIVLAWMNFNAQ